MTTTTKEVAEKAEFTPGPWEVVGRTTIRNQVGKEVAAVSLHSDGSPEASARLIAAAPALYEAAKKAANELSVMLALNPARDGGLYREALDGLNAALQLVQTEEVK